MVVSFSAVATAALPVCAVAALAHWKKWLTLDGSIAATVVGVAISLCDLRPTLMLLVFFFAGTFATKYAARQRRTRTSSSKDEGTKGHSMVDEDDSKRGRNMWQVLATAGVPALICMWMLQLEPSDPWWQHLSVAVMAYFACCSGDTLASELGQLSTPQPVLIVTLRQVPTGRDGAISFLGSVASIFGGALIGACDVHMAGTIQDALLPIYWGAFFGAFGSVLDSLLGALVQTPAAVKDKARWKMLNIVVNLVSSCVCAALAPTVMELDGVHWTLLCVLVLLFVRVSPIFVTS